MTLEERLALLENQVHELLDAWEQLGRDFELIEANIKRGAKGVQPQRNPQLANPQLQQNAGLQGTESAPRQWNWSPLQIKWFPKKGDKGPYEVTEDPYNVDYTKMLADLDEHKGKLNRDNCFYWTFPNGTTVGRKVVQ